MYVRGRGVGDVVPVPFSSWGYVGSPCTQADGSAAIADGVSGSSSALSTLGSFILAGGLLWIAFGGDR